MIYIYIYIYYDLNDRTLNLLMKGKLDMNAVTGDVDAPKFSDAEISSLLDQDTDVCITVVKQYGTTTRPGGAFFPYLNNTIYDLDKHGIFKTVDGNTYKHNCLYLALQAGGLSYIKLQELILTLRNRTIHKCDVSKVCNTLEINIELISIRTDGKKSGVEHYPKSPHIEYNDTYKLGLVKGHYFINDTTTLTPYCLAYYEELKYISECNYICRGTSNYYERDNTGQLFITAHHLFKISMDNIGKLIATMDLTDELLNTQFYYKTEEYKTLYYNNKLHIRKIRRTNTTLQNILFDFGTITSGSIHKPYLCWIYNDETQQESVGVDNCAIDMLNNLPTDKYEIILIAHNANYDCRFIQHYLQYVKIYC